MNFLCSRLNLTYQKFCAIPKPLLHIFLSLSLCALASITHGLQAQEYFAEARVLNVEPLTRLVNTRSVTQACKDSKPARAGLSDLLHWDLGTGPCAKYSQDVAIVAYRVSYEWNDKVYTQRMDQAPGAFVPVKVRVSRQ